MKKPTTKACCHESSKDHAQPDHRKELHRINRIAGQIEGIRRMINNREYCPEIIVQIQAIRAALRSLEAAVLEKHLHSCVVEAFSSTDPKEKAAKVGELLELFRRN